MSTTVTNQDCRFCLSNGTLQGEVLVETPGAFLIEAGTSSGNFLIIPKSHVEELTELPDNWWQEIKQLMPKVPGLADSYNLSLNYGQAAGQRVNHLHFWVVSRRADQPASGKGLAMLVDDANQR